LGKDGRLGAISIMGAVSPPGGDLSDPVVQATLRVVKVFWGLDDKLASARHFPAINWLLSYSLYHKNLEDYLKNNISEEFQELRTEGMRILEEEAELLEIARLIGTESLSDKERLLLETARSIREDFLHQNAFHEIDTYTSLKKQYLMLKVILLFHRKAIDLLKKMPFNQIVELKIREEISQAKYIPEDELDKFRLLEEKIANL
jgi:V/A-type H+-transporting ATPase subunit A